MKIGEDNITSFRIVNFNNLKEDFWYVVPRFRGSTEMTISKKNLELMRQIFPEHTIFYKSYIPAPYLFILVNKKDWKDYIEANVKKVLDEYEPFFITFVFYDINTHDTVESLKNESWNFCIPPTLTYSNSYPPLPF